MFSQKSWLPKSLSIALLFAVSMGIADHASSQEFKIESQVYRGESTMPVSQNVTLFSQGIVYDFRLSNESPPRTTEVTIYDSRQRKVVLIDPVKSVKLEMLDIRVMKFLEGVRRSTEQDKRSKFLVEDEFTEENDLTRGWVTLSSPSITYQFIGKQPEPVSIVPQYLYYLDSSTRLVATDPHQIPPFAKMKLNQAIRQRGWIPSEVQVSVKQNAMFKTSFKAKVKHVLTTSLSKKDRERISQAKSQWLQFEPITLADYRGYNPTKESLLDKFRPQKDDELAGVIGEKELKAIGAKSQNGRKEIAVVDYQEPVAEMHHKAARKKNVKLEPITEKK